MIRHHLGDDFVLITQHDHAQLSGRLARHVGNSLFSAPTPFQETVDGIALHDCGWPLHDPDLHHHFLVEKLVARHVKVHSVTPEQLKLEDVFLRLTKGIVQ